MPTPVSNLIAPNRNDFELKRAIINFQNATYKITNDGDFLYSFLYCGTAVALNPESWNELRVLYCVEIVPMWGEPKSSSFY